MRVSYEIRSEVQEIRLRASAPVTLSTPRGEFRVNIHGECVLGCAGSWLIANPADVTETFEAFCDYSVHSHQQEITNGYVSASGGIRVGLCGTVATGLDGQYAMRQISGLCIRIARIHTGCANGCISALTTGGKVIPTLICGEPSSGKTSLLRDVARQLSMGGGTRFRVSVLDERGELSFAGGLEECDVLRGIRKRRGMEQAVRCLAPDVIVFDEIGEGDGCAAFMAGAQTGVSVITTAHAPDPVRLCRRSSLLRLMRSGAFEQVLFMKGRRQPGEIQSILTVKEVLRQGVKASCP